MSTLQIIYAAIIFVSVTAGALIILLPFAPGRAKQRLDAFADRWNLRRKGRRSAMDAALRQLSGQVREAFAALGGLGNSLAPSALPSCRLQGRCPDDGLFRCQDSSCAVATPFTYLYITLGGAIRDERHAVLLLLPPLGYYLPNFVLARLEFSFVGEKFLRVFRMPLTS